MYQQKPYIPHIEHKIHTFDVEGYRDFRNDRMNAYLCGVWDGSYFFVLRGDDCMKEFIKRFLVHKYRSCIFYAHFGSIFDFPILLQELQTRNDLKIYPVVKGSKIIKLTIKDENEHQWYFNDSSALLNFSLDELTKTFKVGHRKLEVVKKGDDYDRKLYNLYVKDPKLVIEYLKHDCVGLYEVLNEFKLKMLDMGGDLGLTIASTALKTFKHGYQNSQFYMCSKDTNDELRNGYYGGRTEIFRLLAPELKKDDYYFYYDINSLYPYVMEKYRYPISKPNVIQCPPPRIYMDGEGITKAKIISPKDLYVPVLPAKVKVGQDNKLMFLLGDYEGWWDNALLRKAHELGYKVEPQKSYLFDSDYIFKEFVHHFYSIKENSEHGTPMYLIAKLIMNSLYGKYGQRQDCENIIRDNDPDKDKYEILDIVDLDTGWLRVKEESKGKNFLPQIAIHVTAMAQLQLYESIEEILEKGYRVFYCDTDSITTDYKNLPVGKKLGEWKLERRLCYAYFILPKTYKTVDEHGTVDVKAKGYSRALREKIAPDAFERALFKHDTSGFKVQSDRPEMLRPMSSFHRKKKFNSLDYVRRSLQTTYNKRKILKDFDTRPYDIRELLDS